MKLIKYKLVIWLGASLLVYGSYIIIDEEIRIDIKIFDIQKGTVESASTIHGKLDKIFLLEKQLAIKTMEALKINLTDEDKIKLFQIQSENILSK